MEEIITARPEGMSFEQYKVKRKQQVDRDRARRRHGKLVYLSGEFIKALPGSGMPDKKRTGMPALKQVHTDRKGNVSVQYVAMQRRTFK